MSRIFVAGLINIETTVAIDGFPLEYFPVRYPFFGLNTSVSGVGFNLAKALTTLGNHVDLASLVGTGENGLLARKVLAEEGIDHALVLGMLDETAQSVILYDPDGRRQIHVDLKDIQQHRYPVETAQHALQACDIAVMCNVNFSRPLLQAAKESGKWIATDVHALADLEDSYNNDFMRSADILFLSNEALPDSPENIVKALMAKFPLQIVVIGLGAEGALLAVREADTIGRFPAVYTRQVVNTIGAGDALFSAFIDRYLRTKNPYSALQAAMVFASYKIGEKGAAAGFLTGDTFDAWLKKFNIEE